MVVSQGLDEALVLLLSQDYKNRKSVKELASHSSFLVGRVYGKLCGPVLDHASEWLRHSSGYCTYFYFKVEVTCAI